MDKNFLHLSRVSDLYRPVAERITDFREVERRLSPEEIARQVSRCMHCGIPFCHGSGCPLGNLIPDIHEQVRRGNLQNAWNLLASTSPMPEFTARVCPALCEGSCTAQLVSESVMIRQINRLAGLADYLLPGVKEGKILCGNDDPERIGRFYLDRGARAVIIKTGAEGARVCTREGSFRVRAYPPRQIVDTVGAGDSFTAAFCAALLKGHDLETAHEAAVRVSAFVCTRNGAMPELPKELKAVV